MENGRGCILLNLQRIAEAVLVHLRLVCVCVRERERERGGGAEDVEQRSSARLSISAAVEKTVQSWDRPSSIALAYGAKMSLVLRVCCVGAGAVHLPSAREQRREEVAADSAAGVAVPRVTSIFGIWYLVFRATLARGDVPPDGDVVETRVRQTVVALNRVLPRLWIVSVHSSKLRHFSM